MSEINELEKMVEEFSALATEFEENARKQATKGNSAAGKRSRKLSTAMAAMLKNWRAASVAAGKEK